MKDCGNEPLGRRGFLKQAAVGAAGVAGAAMASTPGAAAAAGPGAAADQTPPPAQTPAPASPPPRVDVYNTDRPGSDVMVDVLKTLGFEYVAANPGSTVRASAQSET